MPATAEIKLPVGKEYAGKTLNYSQLEESGITFVQSATVDEDGDTDSKTTDDSKAAGDNADTYVW